VIGGTRDFDDARKMRSLMEANAVDALSKSFPNTDGTTRLELTNVRVDGKEYGLGEQKKALITGRSLNTPVKGTWRLVDEATGSVLDERDDVVMRLPYMTDRGTMVQGGNDVAVANQMRLKPGVYTRRRKSGEVEAQFNVMPGEGTGFRVWLEPESGIMRMAVRNANIPAYHAMRMAGVDDASMRKAWGNEIYELNKAKSDANAAAKMHGKFVGFRGVEGGDQEEEVRAALDKSRLDPWVTERTIGVKADRVTPEALLAATSKVLAVSRGDAEEDDRDDPMYGMVLGAEDFVRERIEKDAGKVRKNLLWRAARDKSLKRVGRAALDPYMSTLMLDSGLVQNLEETNPLSIADQLNRVIKFGEGGLPSKDAVTDEARDVKPGMTGFVDPVAGPESGNIGIDARLAWRTRKGQDGRMVSDFTNTRTGETEALSPEDLHGRVVALPGQDMKVKGAKVAALRGGRVVRVDVSEVDYQVPSMADMYGMGVNLTPMPTGFMPGRAFYASKYWTQYMPLVRGEAPLVRSATPDGTTDFNTLYGRRYATLKAHAPGVVDKVTDMAVSVKGADGAVKSYELAKDFPYNRISSLTHRPVVKPGDKVDEGSMLAASNFTDDTGAVAMGRNLRVAVMPYKGMNFEDAWVISESAAAKLATSRLIGFDKETRDGTEVSRTKFVSAFAKAYKSDQLAQLDDDGVIKPGSTVVKGDPLVLAVGPRQLSAEDAALGNLHKVLRNSLKDKSEVWPYDFPGVVTDAALTSRGAFINVKTEPPVAEGDKLANAHAQKGVVGKVLPDDRMPVNAATGEPYEALFNPMGVISRMAPNQLADMALGKIAAKTGKPYILPQEAPKEGWVEFAKAELAKNGMSDADDVTDPSSGHTARGVGAGVMHVMPFHHIAEKKISGRSTGGYDANQQPSRGGHEGAKRMGCFIAAQPVMTSYGERKIGTIVEKRTGDYVLTWLESMGEWGYRRVVDWFSRKVPVSDVLSIHIEGAPSVYGGRSKFKHSSCVHPTKNHGFYTFDGGKKPAGELRVGDKLSSWGPVPTEDQIGAMFGTLLGDASVSDAMVSFMHSVKQKNYTQFKQNVFSSLMAVEYGCSPSISKGGQPRGRSVVCLSLPHVVSHARNVCVKSGRKTVTPEWLSLVSELGVALWLLDDGYFSAETTKTGGRKYRGTIATNGYAHEEVSLLSDMLSSRFGVDDARLQYYAKSRYGVSQYIIRFNKTGYLRLVELIARHIPWRVIPASKSALVEQVKTIQSTPGYKLVESDISAKLGKVPVVVKEIAPYTPDKPVDEVMVYNITVDETHTYTVGGALVANSLELNALLAHGATEVIKDAMTVRGTKNEDFWLALKLGRPLPEPRQPFAFDKFTNLLKAGGVNMRRRNDDFDIMPMTDKAVGELAAHEVSDSGTVSADTLAPMPGGLFDERITGGLTGNRWAYVKLDEPMPSPVMDEPIKKLLGWTGKRYRDVLSGREPIDGKLGGEAIKAELGKIDVDKDIEYYKAEVRNRRGADRDKAVKCLRYLDGCNKTGVKPTDWIITKVPVLPPVFRPVSKMGGTILSADLNDLYRDVIEVNNGLKALKKDLPPEALTEERERLYDSVTAAYGLGESSDPEMAAKGLKGAIRQVVGANPKFGFFQSKVLGKPVDSVARGVITPDAELDMDSIGLPEEMSWELYAPYVQRRLVRRGFPPAKAKELIDQRHQAARDEMLAEMDERPVLASRAPSWHKFNIMAFTPRPHKGHVIRVSPLIITGFNADFDGNCCDYNTVIILRLSKSAIELFDEKGYTLVRSKLELTKEGAMQAGESKVEIKADGQVVRLRIGEFPRIGEPGKDKNGADVYVVPAGVEVLTIDPATSQPMFSAVTTFTVERLVKCVKVDTATQSVVVSDNESLCLFDHKSGGLVKSAPAGAKGSFAPVVRRLATEGGKYSRELGWWIGAFVSDGWATDGRMVGYAKQEDAKRNEFVKIARSHVHENFTLHEYAQSKDEGKLGDSVKVHLNGSDLANAIRAMRLVLPGESRQALRKTIPVGMLLEGGDDFLWGVLSGMLDGDGSVVKNMATGKPRYTLRLATSSQSLMEAMRLLCWRLGLRSRVTTTPPRGHSGESYTVMPSMIDVWPNLSKLSCVGARERGLLAEMLGSSISHDNRDYVPLSLKEAADLASTALRVKDTAAYSALSQRRATPWLSRDALARLLAATPIPEVYARMNDNIIWEKVESVVDAGEREVFDFGVPASKVFAVDNGLIIWDTMNFHVPASDKSVTEAKAKMMPSANLFKRTDMHSPQHLPSKETVMALARLTLPANPTKQAVKYRTQGEAVAAYRRGELSFDDPVEISQQGAVDA
jgi:DNA-directed RNA polymerase beta subunit